MLKNPYSLSEPVLQQATPPVSTGSVFAISEKELPLVLLKADAGDALSSFKLYQYFKFSKSNLSEAYKWLLKAAEQEHGTAQYNLAASLTRKKEYSNALIWAIKAKNNEIQGADELIKGISESMSYEQK